MTRDDILKLEAGRELDALVAEKVMGEKKPVYSHEHPIITQTKWSATLSWYCSPDWDKGDICEWLPKPYSTDIAAAWEVIEYLAGNSVELEVVRDNIERFSVGHDSDGWCCNVWWFKNTQSSHAVEGIYAKTAPLAICRAALLAVLGSDEPQ